jgi:hypothetical protein
VPGQSATISIILMKQNGTLDLLILIEIEASKLGRIWSNLFEFRFIDFHTSNSNVEIGRI